MKNKLIRLRKHVVSFPGKAAVMLLPALLFCLLGCQEKQDKSYQDKPATAKKQEISDEEYIKRGEYLVTSIGCADCHSPKQMSDRGPMEIEELKLSGYRGGTELPAIDHANLKNGWMLMNADLTAAVGPWGVSYAANLTSDETGIGNWSFEQFKTAMREGKFKGMKNGRQLLPPMPWQNFAHLSDEDLLAMFRYLKSTKPVKNAVPPPIPPQQLDSLRQKLALR